MFTLPEKDIQEITGSVEYHYTMRYPALPHPHDIIVWLPPSYHHNTQKRYPVLYMHDGQNIMDPRTAYIGYDWRIDETATLLIKKNLIEEIIIVGIYNSPDRLSEYSDCELGNRYMDFLIHSVKNFIDVMYRTKPEKNHTATMGASMGGLISFLLVWKHSDIFGKAACLSNSFYYDNDKLFHEIENYQGKKKNIQIYLDCGGREKELLHGYHRMVHLLQEKKFTKGKDLEYYLERKGRHNEQTWARRSWRGLVFLFGK